MNAGIELEVKYIKATSMIMRFLNRMSGWVNISTQGEQVE